jgi:hypothetical protein
MAADLYTQPGTKGAQDLRKKWGTGIAGSDRSSLSNSGELVSLAKNLIPADRATRLQALHAAVGAGQYETDPIAVGQALVNEHLDS